MSRKAEVIQQRFRI